MLEANGDLFILDSTDTKDTPSFKSIETREDYKKLRELELFLLEHNVYILSSIEGKGIHVGRFKQISLDADGNPVIECDIDKESSVR